MSCSHWFESQWVGCGGQLEYPSFAGLVVLPYRISAFKLRGVVADDLTILPLTSITCTHEQASGVVTCQLPTRAQTSPRLPASNAPRALHGSTPLHRTSRALRRYYTIKAEFVSLPASAALSIGAWRYGRAAGPAGQHRCASCHVRICLRTV